MKAIFLFVGIFNLTIAANAATTSRLECSKDVLIKSFTRYSHTLLSRDYRTNVDSTSKSLDDSFDMIVRLRVPNYVRDVRGADLNVEYNLATGLLELAKSSYPLDFSRDNLAIVAIPSPGTSSAPVTTHFTSTVVTDVVCDYGQCTDPLQIETETTVTCQLSTPL